VPAVPRVTARALAVVPVSYLQAVVELQNGQHRSPGELADPNWLLLSVNTAAGPSYPGAHSTISAAAAVLASFYGDDQSFSVISPALLGVTCSFTSFSSASREAGLSRIYAGQHTRLDDGGVRLGDDVAGFVLHDALLPANDSCGR
jgi:hypothetical protein